MAVFGHTATIFGRVLACPGPYPAPSFARALFFGVARSLLDGRSYRVRRSRTRAPQDEGTAALGPIISRARWGMMLGERVSVLFETLQPGLRCTRIAKEQVIPIDNGS